ncbi:MAG: RDD family protein, partial [Gemmatimonadota bacterium]
AVPPSAALFAVETRVAWTGSWLSPAAVPMLLLAAVGALLALLYFPALERLWGQTVGKRFFGLAVAREDGLRVGWWDAAVRRLPLFFEVFWLDALFAPFTEKRQRAFDIVAGTVVVPGVQSGSRTAGWTLVAVLWLLPPSVLSLLWGSTFPLPL